VRIDRKRKFLATTFLRALGLGTDEEIIRTFYSTSTLKIKDKKLYWVVDENLVGRRLSLDIPDPSKKGTTSPIVPETAILWRGSLPAVYKIDDTGAIKLRLIRIGERTADGKIVVISGIRAGDKILAEPGAGTRSGS
jgi:hypothetical protein